MGDGWGAYREGKSSNRRRGAVAGGSGDRRWRIGPAEDDGDTLPASGEKAAINLFLAIDNSSSLAHRQRLRMEAPAMAATYQCFRGLCVSV